MQIETKSASLDTLAVTIRALHVSGKQMTLAVFRQLPTISACNEDGSIRPMEYWGIVHYAIKHEADTWVICASGGILYRCPLQPAPNMIPACERDLRKAREHLAWARRIKAAGADREQLNLAWSTKPRGLVSFCKDSHIQLEREVVALEEWLERCKRRAVTDETLARLPQLFIAV